MRCLAFLLTLMLLPAPAWARDLLVPAAQVAMQPLAEGETPDIEALARIHWKAYYNGGGPYAFYRGDIRAGRMDLNGDDIDELFILIDSPAWVSAKGQPLLVAKWTPKGWYAIGWSFADSDSVFLAREVVDGWRTITTPAQILRWHGKEYTAIERPGR